jgi:hypothetical protein
MRERQRRTHSWGEICMQRDLYVVDNDSGLGTKAGVDVLDP